MSTPKQDPRMNWRPRVFRSKADGSIAIEIHRHEDFSLYDLVYIGPVAGIRFKLAGRPLTLEFVTGSQILDFEELVPGCDRPHEIEGER